LVDASGWSQGCKGIRIAVRGGTIAIEHISIVYATGRVHAENVSPPVRAGPGAPSRVFAATNDARQLRLVTIRFSRVDRSARAVTVELWGLQAASPAANGHPRTVRRDFKLEAPRVGGGPPTVARRAEPPPLAPRSLEPSPSPSAEATRP